MMKYDMHETYPDLLLDIIEYTIITVHRNLWYGFTEKTHGIFGKEGESFLLRRSFMLVWTKEEEFIYY